MTKTRLYIARHGKTMFNTIGRAQGWSDTPLTEAGERGIRELGLGLKEAGLSFMTNGSASGVLVVLTVLMMAISSWEFYPVSLRSMISIS